VNIKLLLVTMALFGFLIGLVLGYVYIGYDIEQSCLKTIGSYENFISKMCVNTYKDNFSLGGFFNGSFNISN